MEADGKGKVVSSPRVITADQQKALIEQGEELPYQVATSSGATSLQFRKANLKLEVTPQITPEGNVILDVDITKDSVGRSTLAGFAINTKHVKTQVLVENGGTVVIGGIFEQNDREDITKVPFLGDVPYLGWLFKTKTNTTTEDRVADLPHAEGRHRPHGGALTRRLHSQKASEPRMHKLLKILIAVRRGWCHGWVRRKWRRTPAPRSSARAARRRRPEPPSRRISSSPRVLRSSRTPAARPRLSRWLRSMPTAIRSPEFRSRSVPTPMRSFRSAAR